MKVKKVSRWVFLLCVTTGLLLVGCGSTTETPAPASKVINLNAAVTAMLPAGDPPFSVIKSDGTIGTASSTDIMWMDPMGSNMRLYETDRGATSPTPGTAYSGRIWVIDAVTDTVLFPITGFYGKHTNSGPNGVLVANSSTGAKELWAGDGDSSVRWLNLNAGLTAIPVPNSANGGAISTGGTARADELAYDPVHDIIMIGNDADTPVFLTFINRATKAIKGYIKYDTNTPLGGTDVSLMTAPTGATLATAGHGPNATNGIEQPVYDPDLGYFYQAVPATTENPNGEVDQIDPVLMKVTARYPFNDFCTPHGLSLGPSHHLAVACGDKVNMRIKIMDVTPGAPAGTILATFTNFGGTDMAWFNLGDMKYYFGGGSNLGPDGKVLPSIGVVDALTNTFVKSFPTGSSKDGKSVAVNPQNNHVYVPVSEVGGGGIEVFSRY
jgi:hypothetical protein